MPQTSRIVRLIALILATSLLLLGCAESDNPAGSAAEAPTESPTASLPDGLFLSAAPEGVQPIAELKQSANEGDEVTVRAVVGGRQQPIVDGRASAMIVDAGLNNTCLVEDNHCPTPWDYCCEPREAVTANLATLQVVNADGRVVPAELSPRIQPLSTVVVRGVVGARPDAEVLTINATGIHVEPPLP